ncbi:MAG: glycosyltransferase [Desulfamplus sp.]|nr:glycosyltransferase [Desulfamplus sp.]
MINKANVPTVSIIIPTFNRAWCIAGAVESVLGQEYPGEMEIIVVDDGSSDTTREVLGPYKDKISLLVQENMGVSAARNRGIEFSSGEFIAFLDSDDLWMPEKLSCQMDFFMENPDAMICQTEEIWIRNGRRVNPKKRHKKPSGMIFEPSLRLCLVSPSAVMMRRDFFHVKGFFDETLPACEDYDLWLRTAVDMPIHLIDKPCIIKKGGHGDQLSSMHSLDRYRIESLAKLLEHHNLTRAQRESAMGVLREKCTIYLKGCLKRDKQDDVQYCEAMLKKTLENRHL